MAFETGTFTSLADLRTKVRTFLAAQGFTVTAGDAIHDGGSVYVELTYSANLHFDGVSNHDALELKAGTGESGGAITGWNGSTHQVRAYFGRSSLDGQVIMTFPGVYYFFHDAVSNNFACVLNHDTNFIQWLGFGEVEKIGAWSGGFWAGATFGTYFVSGNASNYFMADLGYLSNFGQRSCGYGFWYGTDGDATVSYSSNISLSCDIDGAPGDWLNNSEDYAPSFSGSRLNTYMRWLGKSDFNDKAPLVPIYVAVLRAASKITVAGHLPFARHVYIKNYGIGDIMTLGADRWMVFPHIRKTDHDLGLPNDGYSLPAGDQYSSGNYGFAIKYDGP